MDRDTKAKEADQIRQFKEEIASGTWLKRARHRSGRRKSTWNLLLPVLGIPLLVACTLGLFFLGWFLHSYLHGSAAKQTFLQFIVEPMRPSSFLLLVPSLFAAIAPAFLVANFLVYQIGPARRAMNQEDQEFPSTGYGPSQRALSRIALWLLGFWLLCVLVAAVLP